MEDRKIRAIISGGGTGGHIFPALSIANRLKELNPETEIIFVGANGRMEMDKVPAAGYKIYGLEVAGLKRSLSLSNLALPFKYAKGIRKAKAIIREFKPDIAIGVGGYCSAPLLWAAQSMGVPTLIQEQNGFAGLSNKILGKRAKKICVAYENMERFFPADRIVMSGNPIRSNIVPADEQMKQQAYEHYGLDPQRRQLLVVGGSLGCRTLNTAMQNWIEAGCPGGEDVEVIWQCGSYYKKSMDQFMEGKDLPYIHMTDFISRMDLAYAVSDVIISRSGASSVSELCATGKASIFVPSPNVAEDHQTHNAMALVNKDAALMVKDSETREKLIGVAESLLSDNKKIETLEKNISLLARRDASEVIARELARALGAELVTGKLWRNRRTRTQTRMGMNEKAGNVSGAFSVHGSLPYRHVLLVDDTFTTGATLVACSAAVLPALRPGARISVATLAFVSS